MVAIDRIVTKFGLLTVVSFNRSEKVYPASGKRAYTKRFYDCLCECGNPVVVVINSLTSGNTSSCGCLRSAMLVAKAEDLSNQKFNRLTALTKVEGKGSFWNCICDCGNKSVVKAESLKSGGTKSCGCLQKEKASEVFVTYNREYREFMGKDPNEPMGESRKYQRSLMAKLRPQIFERDSYTCALCSKVGSKLNAHHIRTWAFYPELRFELSNLVTLCKDCHWIVHNGKFNDFPDEALTILLEGYTKVIEEDFVTQEFGKSHGLF